MAKNSINQKSSKSVQLDSVITVLPNVGNVKGVGEPKKPACSSKVNPSGQTAVLTHEQISEKAWGIWQSNGCKHGEDERNWSEAETQLKVKPGID